MKPINDKSTKLNYTDSSLRTLAMETTDREIMLELAACDHWGVRWNLVKNENVDIEILESLSEDISPHVLMELINNKKIDEEAALDIYLSNKDRLSKFKQKLANPRNCNKTSVVDFIKSH